MKQPNEEMTVQTSCWCLVPKLGDCCFLLQQFDQPSAFLSLFAAISGCHYKSELESFWNKIRFSQLEMMEDYIHFRTNNCDRTFLTNSLTSVHVSHLQQPALLSVWKKVLMSRMRDHLRSESLSQLMAILQKFQLPDAIWMRCMKVENLPWKESLSGLPHIVDSNKGKVKRCKVRRTFR